MRRLAILGTAATLGLAAGIPGRVSGAGTVDNLAFGGGSVMSSSTTYAVFWLPAGAHFEPNSSDSAYESLVQQFLGDVGGTSLYNVVTQYSNGVGTHVVNASTFGGSYVDTTAYPAPGTAANPIHDGDIQASVSRAMAAKGWTADPTHLFLVYTAYNIQGCRNAGTEQCSTDTYCAYHSSFVPGGGGQPVLYAAVSDPAGNGGTCLAQGGSGAYPNGDSAADSVVSLTSKELFAAVTDPMGDGWTDSSGAEIGDKCDWSFGTVASDGSNVTLGSGHKYIVQQEWSNDADGCALSYTTRASRLTPTPTTAGTATPTPTLVPGRSYRGHWYQRADFGDEHHSQG